jgi:hypothetical protein
MPLDLFWKRAEMKPIPNDTAVTVPAETLKRDEFEDVQVASAVTSLVVPSENIPCAVSWLVSPTARRTLLPVTRIDVITGTGADAGVGDGAGSINRGGESRQERVAAARTTIRGPKYAFNGTLLKIVFRESATDYIRRDSTSPAAPHGDPARGGSLLLEHDDGRQHDCRCTAKLFASGRGRVEALELSVGRRPFGGFDDQHVHRFAAGFQLETELLLQCGHVDWVLRVIGAGVAERASRR